MKLNDAVWGALLLLLRGGRPRPRPALSGTIPGQKVGPAMFPGLLAVGLGDLRACC